MKNLPRMVLRPGDRQIDASVVRGGRPLIPHMEPDRQKAARALVGDVLARTRATRG